MKTSFISARTFKWSILPMLSTAGARSTGRLLKRGSNRFHSYVGWFTASHRTGLIAMSLRTCLAYHQAIFGNEKLCPKFSVLASFSVSFECYSEEKYQIITRELTVGGTPYPCLGAL